ncbi:hypothetical protein F4776DRAFT_662480 [Hypoxylon sp. NC0597]|nr:hypothetical protein F4776DRAFT_662480 [Hypoxylon sp. NC0597]
MGSDKERNTALDTMLGQIARCKGRLDSWEQEVKSKVLSDDATGEIQRWINYAWEGHNIVRLYSYQSAPNLQGKISHTLSGLDGIESRLRRLERKNEEKKREKQKEKGKESKGKSKRHRP